MRETLGARLYGWASDRLYNELAWAYDAVSWLVSLGRWDRWRRLALKHVDGGRVLEVGFGTGELLIEMACRGWEVVGLDLSPAMHRVTARKLRRRGLNVPRVCGRVQALPFPDRWFDAIISTFPTGYIADPVALSEFHRVLRDPDPDQSRPGGRLIVVGAVTQIELAWLRRLERLLFGSTGADLVAEFQLGSVAVGLQVRTVVHYDPPVRLPVFIAERCV